MCLCTFLCFLCFLFAFSSVCLVILFYSDLFGFVFILFYYYSLSDCFLIKERKGIGLDGRVGGETLEEAGEGDTVIRLYGKNIF